jgi:hypothetical protein
MQKSLDVLNARVAQAELEIECLEKERKSLPWSEANRLNKRLIALYKAEDVLKGDQQILAELIKKK